MSAARDWKKTSDSVAAKVRRDVGVSTLRMSATRRRNWVSVSRKPGVGSLGSWRRISGMSTVVSARYSGSDTAHNGGSLVSAIFLMFDAMDASVCALLFFT